MQRNLLILKLIFLLDQESIPSHKEKQNLSELTQTKINV